MADPDEPARAAPPGLAALLDGWHATPVEAGEAGATVVRLVRGGAVRYLKHGAGRIADDVTDECVRLVWLADRLPAARLVHFVRDAAGAWLLTEAVPGRTGDEWLAADPAMLPAVILAFAGFLRDLHALPVADCPFEAGAALRMAAARRLIDAGLVDKDDFDDDHAGWSAEQVWATLRPPPSDDRVVTHGDFSLGNLLLDEAGRVTGCIDVGRLGVADRYQDIAILWQNLAEYGAAAQAAFLAAYGVATPDEARLTFHRCLDELF